MNFVFVNYLGEENIYSIQRCERRRIIICYIYMARFTHCTISPQPKKSLCQGITTWLQFDPISSFF